MIYFLRATDGGPIKIGTSIQLTERLKVLSKETGQDLEVLAVVDGGRGEEQALHGRFSHLRVVNEWFEPGDDLLGFIVQEGRAWDGQNEAEFARKPMVVQIRGSQEWKSWIEGLAQREHDTVAKFMERLIRQFARDNGYENPPLR